MKAFIIDGSERSFADIITENKISGLTCSVASYGFGVTQVERLLLEFDQLLLLTDESHSKLNPIAYDAVVKMATELDYFTVNFTKTHAKFALIDNEIIIFTSANLSKNKKIESYLIGNYLEVKGIDQIKDLIGSPDDIFKTQDNNLINIDFDKMEWQK